MAKVHFIPVPGEEDILSDYIAAAVGSGGPEIDTLNYELIGHPVPDGDPDLLDYE